MVSIRKGERDTISHARWKPAADPVVYSKAQNTKFPRTLAHVYSLVFMTFDFHDNDNGHMVGFAPRFNPVFVACISCFPPPLLRSKPFNILVEFEYSEILRNWLILKCFRALLIKLHQMNLGLLGARADMCCGSTGGDT